MKPPANCSNFIFLFFNTEIWKHPWVCWARFSGLNDPDSYVGVYEWRHPRRLGQHTLWCSLSPAELDVNLQVAGAIPLCCWQAPPRELFPAVLPDLQVGTSVRMATALVAWDMPISRWKYSQWLHMTKPCWSNLFTPWHSPVSPITLSGGVLKRQVDVMLIFWQPPMEEIEHQPKTQRKGSRNLSLLILLSVLILGTLPHSTLIGKSCQKWWCHHQQAHLTLAADCQCWVQVNKSPGTWMHAGVLLQCRHSMIPR